MILLSELSRRRIRSINKLVRVNRTEVVMVIRVDKEKGKLNDRIDLILTKIQPVVNLVASLHVPYIHLTSYTIGKVTLIYQKDVLTLRTSLSAKRGTTKRRQSTVC